MRKLRILLAAGALTLTFFAAQRPAGAYPYCGNDSAHPYGCICPNGAWKGCVVDALYCSGQCGGGAQQ